MSLKSQADKIKEVVTIEDAARHYGLEITYKGFMHCPMRNHTTDKTASLKVYTGDRPQKFYCFGCHAHGTVIDFVAGFFGITTKQAISRIWADFSMGPVSKSQDAGANFARLMEERRERQRKEDALYREYLEKVELFRFYWECLKYFQPVRTGDEVYYHPFYVEAVKNISYVEDWLDEYMNREK